MAEGWRLLGIAVILLGLFFRLRPPLVVVAGALVTGLLAGIPLMRLLEILGQAFVDNRLMTLFVLTLPAIGVAERYGLREESASLIRRFRAATPGRLYVLYQIFRVLHGALGIRLNGHAVFVRPLLYPMALGAMTRQAGPAELDRIQAASAASENYGNFYGQNLSPVQPGVLLVYGVLTGLGCGVSLWRLVLFSIPVVAVSIAFAVLQFRALDRKLK
jgi:uncharacterized membrane protein